MQVLNFLFMGLAQASPQASPVQQLPKAAAGAVAGGGGGVGAFSTLLVILYILVCVALVFFVLIQTTKSEGLSGVIGGATQSIFRGKKSVEEKITHWTTYFAAAFVVLSIIIALVAYR